jgi:hypothetical protein
MIRTESLGKKQAKKRLQTPLHAFLDKNLNSYVSAACAAGVSMLACARSAEAKIVYTPANAYIVPNSTLNLDLSHDGKPDFLLSNIFSTYDSRHARKGNLKIQPQDAANAVWGTGTYASALRRGVQVGANKRFQQGHNGMAKIFGFCTSNCSFRSGGPWLDVTRQYLGLKFSIKGKIHYGWARLNVTVNHVGVFAVLTGYAYETVPNKPIVTGQTKGATADIGGAAQNISASFGPNMSPAASLGLLAQGVNGLEIWRKRQATTN